MPAVVLRGRVADPHGQAVPGAEIEATAASRPGRLAAEAIASEDGWFRLDGLAAGEEHLLRIEAKGYAPLVVSVPARVAGGPAPPLSLVLRPGRQTFGLVVDGDERPIAGARVRLWSPERSSRPPFTAATDEEGIFRLEGVAPGSYSLGAQAPGFAPLIVPGVSVPRGSEPWALGTLILEDGVTLAGHVLDSADDPVAGATVHARAAEGFASPWAEGDESTTRTDHGGRFSLPDLPRDQRLDLAVAADGFARATLEAVEVPAEEPVVVVLDAASSLAGTVVTQVGTPVAEALVVAAPEAAPPSHAVSDEEGRFVFEGLPPGTVRVSATAPGHGASDELALSLSPGEEHPGLEIVLTAGALLSGRVVSTAGEGLGGAVIEAHSTASSHPRQGSVQLQTTADGHGDYRLEGLQPGEWTLVARHPDYLPHGERLEVEPGLNAHSFTLAPGAEVAGRVVDSEGSPVADARVRLDTLGVAARPAADLAPIQPPRGITAGDGRFRLRGVVDGLYRLSVSKAGFAPTTLDEPVEIRSASVEGLLIRLQPGLAIIGQLSGLSFEELSRVEVVASGPDSRGGEGTIDPAGRYRIEDLAPGEWQVAAHVEGSGRRARGRVTLTPGAGESTLDLDFTTGLVLSGSVFLDGRPAPAAYLRLKGSDALIGASTTTNHRGSFRLEGLEAGTYQLAVETRPQGVSYSETLELAADREVMISIRSASVAGRVVDATAGHPLEGARVVLEEAAAPGSIASGPGGWPPNRPGARAATGPEGEFQLAAVAGGNYLLSVELEGYIPARVPIEASATEGRAVQIDLSPAAGLGLVVVGPGGQPPPFIDVALLDARGDAVVAGSYPVTAEGLARISTAPPGRWFLVASVNGQSVATRPVEVPHERVSVALEPATTLRIVVPELAAANAAAQVRLTSPGGAHLTLPLPGGALQSTWSLVRGEALLAGLPAGTWSVEILSADGRVWRHGVDTAPGVLSEVVVN